MKYTRVLWVRLKGKRLCDYFKMHAWEITSWRGDLGMGTRATVSLTCARCGKQVGLRETDTPQEGMSMS